MGKQPDLRKVEALLKKGEAFTLTDAQYERKTGCMLPKDKNYLKNRSALAKKAKENGYKIEVLEKTVLFTKEKKK